MKEQRLRDAGARLDDIALSSNASPLPPPSASSFGELTGRMDEDFSLPLRSTPSADASRSADGSWSGGCERRRPSPHACRWEAASSTKSSSSEEGAPCPRGVVGIDDGTEAGGVGSELERAGVASAAAGGATASPLLSVSHQASSGLDRTIHNTYSSTPTE